MPTRKYLATLQIEGDEVPVAGFSFSAPPGALGVQADVTVADVTLSYDRGAPFTLTLRHETGDTPKTRLIKNGKVAGDNRAIALGRVGGNLAPADSYSIKGIDTIGDRWRLAPRIPIIIYDPAVVTIEDGETDTNVNDSVGNRIYAELIEISALDLNQILSFAYVTKAGFAEVIHNLPNYQIPRADFTLNANYHSIAASFYSYFKPIVFEDDNRLFILDIYGELPEGIVTGARTVQADGYITYSKAKPETAVVNAVLLSHKEISVQSFIDDELPEGVTQRTEVEVKNVGTYGETGWQQTLFRRYIAEIHDDADDPGKITSEVVWRVETRVTGKDENGIVRELLVEDQIDRYSNSWRLKLGYTKQVTVYAENGAGSALLQQALTETNQLIWRPNPQAPGEYLKVWSLTQTEGLVVVEGDPEEDPEAVVRTPLVEATRNRTVPDDESASIERMPISSVSEYWRNTGADQIEIEVTKIDHLTNRTENTKTVQHVGTNSVRVRNGESINTRQVLLTDPDSDEANGAREPISFDAGYIPYAVAKELALRALEQANNPKDTISCQLVSFDGGIRRGSIRRIQDRDGNEVTAIITGYSVTGTQQGRGLITISQSIEGVVIV
jgi:hypothetical protein